MPFFFFSMSFVVLIDLCDFLFLYEEELLFSVGGEILGKVSQESLGHSIPRNVQGQTG